jgi:2-polyprenyl-3-methyl-5-hydroxy-6-metoxy-1,4-benzoquinol methylase
VTDNPTQYTGLLSPFLRSRRIAAARPYLTGRVLDVGCADGPLAEVVPPDRYVGVELDPRALGEARAKHPAHRFEASGDLPASERFDTVVALAVLEHVPRPVAWLEQWGSHLSPGGQIVLTTPHAAWEPLHGLAAKLRLTSPEAQEEHETTFDRESLTSALAEAGLRVVTYRRFLARMNQLVVATVPA